MDFQELIIVGRVAKLDFSNGRLGFSVAVNKRDKNGKESVVFFPVSIFGKPAEALSKMLEKGAKVMVTGEIVTFKKKDGSEGFGVSASRVIALDGKKNAVGQGQGEAVDLANLANMYDY